MLFLGTRNHQPTLPVHADKLLSPKDITPGSTTPRRQQRNRVVGAVCICLLVALYLYSPAWDVPLAVVKLCLNAYPIVLVRIALAMATLRSVISPLLSRMTGNTMTMYASLWDPWLAEWYWLNAWLLYVAIKVNFAYWTLAGQQTLPTSQGNKPATWGLRIAELTIMYPLCLATTWALLRQSPLRFPLELVTSTLLLLALFRFLATEFHNKAPVDLSIVDRKGQIGQDAEFVFGTETVIRHSLFECLYTWFGYVFCTMIWSLVPLHRTCRALTECLRSQEQSR